MIEFLFGFVGVAVVITMLWQINDISVEHMRMVIDTRNTLADKLSSSSSQQMASDVEYLKGWDAGPDDADYTQDDTPQSGDASSFLNDMDIAMEPSELGQMLQSPFPGNKLSAISGSSWGESLGLMEVQGETGAIDILPAVQELVTGMDSLNIKKKIYMPVVNKIWDSSGM